MTATPATQWGDELAGAGLGGLLAGVEDPLATLAEPEITGEAGSYWPRSVDPEAEVDPDDEAARDRAVADAMVALERLLAVMTRRDRRKSVEKDARDRLLLLGAIDRALADPRSGYLRRLRRERSAILRERHHRDGVPVAELAALLGVSRTRVRSLMANNVTYVSAERELALEAMREESAKRRAERKAEAEARRAAERERRAAERLAQRVAEGRVLQARLDAGEDRDVLIVSTGYSRQRLTSLLAEARRADEVEADLESLPAAA